MTVANRTSTSLALQWRNLAHQLNGGVRFYVALISKTNSSVRVPTKKLVSPNATSTQITSLDPYTEYNLTVVGVSGDGTPFKSANVLAITDEGGNQILTI